MCIAFWGGYGKIKKSEAPTPLIEVANGGSFFGEKDMRVKEPTTYSEQAELLIKKGLSVDNEEDCIKFLKRVNYYRLSGYFGPMVARTDPDTTLSFDRVERVYEFDAELRSITLRVIEKIEVYLRSQISYYHAHKYGALGYLDSNNYHQHHNHQDFMNRVNNCIKERKSSPVVIHHNAKYGSQFPIWVVIDFFSLGMLSYFYRGMKNRDKAEIANDLYGTNYQTMQSWLHCLTNLRNCCAHYSRLYYFKFPAIPIVPKGIGYTATRRYFAQIYMLKWMYPTPDTWENDVLKPLKRLIRNYKPSIDLKDLDFPRYWNAMLKK